MLTNPSVGLAVRLSGGADADQVGVAAPPTATIAGGIFVEGTGSVLRNIRVALGTDQPTRTGVHFIAGGRLEDSFVQAGIGVSGGTPALEVRRTVVRATIGFRAFGGQITLTNALVTQHPLSGGASFDALEATNGNNPADPGILKASNVTIDGEGPGFAVGAAARLNSGGTGGASIGLEGAVIRNVDRTFDRLGDGTNPASITVGHSSYDATKVSTLGPGTLIQAATNITNDPDPRFLGPAHLDYRLRHDSPLLERGDPTPIVADEDPDLGGRARVRDSDGDGTALVDIGAFEYQRLPPTAAFTVAPSLFGGCLRR